MTGNETLCFLYLITATKAVVSPKSIVKIFLKVEWFQDDLVRRAVLFKVTTPR